MDHVHYQTKEAIDEVFPGTRFALNATLQEFAVDVRKSHNQLPLRSGKVPRVMRSSGRTTVWFPTRNTRTLCPTSFYGGAQFEASAIAPPR